MTESERVLAFVEKHPEIDQSLLPKVTVWWNEDDVDCYLDTKTGEIDNINDSLKLTGSRIKYSIIDSNEVCVNVKRDVDLLYCKYDKELETVQLCIVVFKAKKRWKKEVLWEEKTQSIYICKGSKTVYDRYGQYNSPVSGYGVWYANYIHHMCQKGCTRKCLENIKEFIGTFLTTECGSSRLVEHQWDLEDWYKYNSPKKKSGKKQNVIDAVTEVELRNINDICEEYPEEQIEEQYSWEREPHLVTVSNIIYFEKIDGYDIIRFITRKDNNATETFRVYVNTKKSDIFCTAKYEDGWTVVTKAHKAWRDARAILSNIDNFDPESKIRFIRDIISKFSSKDNNVINYIINALRYPIIEKLYKAGYLNLADGILRSDHINKEITHTFPDYNPKKKDLCSQLGVNKYQLGLIDANTAIFYRKKIILQIKDMGFKVSDLDEKTTNLLFWGLTRIGSWYGDSWLCYIPNEYGVVTIHTNYFAQRTLNDAEKARSFFLKMVKIIRSEEKGGVINIEVGGIYNESRGLELLRDAIYNHSALVDKYKINVNWSDIRYYNDIKKIHDVVVEQNNQQQREDKGLVERERQKDEDRVYQIQFENNYKKREFLRFEDDNFIIRQPESLGEIRQEGLDLHHCVSGYAGRHALGQTTIMFMRKKSNPEKSFFTIELNEDFSSIRQAHGNFNSWLSYKDAETSKAIPTILEWCNKNKIKTGTSIKL